MPFAMGVAGMGEVHQLLLEFGKEKALQAASDRRVVEAAAAYLASEVNAPGSIYSGWAQAALPHRRLPDDALWKVRNDRVSLIIEPGARSMPDGTPRRVGVPYGSRARLILIYLQSEALRTGSREVELGRSLRVWLGRLGIPIGGKSIAEVRDQCDRISLCHMTFEVAQGRRIGLTSEKLVTSAMLDEGDGVRLIETVRLSDSFYEQLRRYPVQVSEAAVRQISNNSMALDVYCWLAYRLHVLTGPTPITWQALHAQFGHGIARMVHFKKQFRPTLALALSVYPEARVGQTEQGVVLHPSTPPSGQTPVRALPGR
jgi:hypothetical protein